jgi:hypothetical protein
MLHGVQSNAVKFFNTPFDRNENSKIQKLF